MQDSRTIGIGFEDKLKAAGGYTAPYYDSTQADRMAKEAAARGKK